MIADFSFSIVLDLAVAVLLIATLAYAVALNRKLTQLRGDKGEMQNLIGHLVAASEQARKGIEVLRAHAGEAGTRLQKDLERSKGRADELAFLIQRAEAAAQRLEQSSAKARTKDLAVDTEKTAPVRQAPRRATAQPSVPPEEANLVKMLQGMR